MLYVRHENISRHLLKFNVVRSMLRYREKGGKGPMKSIDMQVVNVHVTQKTISFPFDVVKVLHRPTAKGHSEYIRIH